jgi:hypothetical protein
MQYLTYSSLFKQKKNNKNTIMLKPYTRSKKTLLINIKQ